MFELNYPKIPEQPINPPELTPMEAKDLEDMQRFNAARIQQEVERRSIDPDYIRDALLVLLEENPVMGIRLADVILNHGDRGINLANIKLDVLDWIEYKVKQDAERGVF